MSFRVGEVGEVGEVGSPNLRRRSTPMHYSTPRHAAMNAQLLFIKVQVRLLSTV